MVVAHRQGPHEFNASWHFASVSDLKAVQFRDGRSMGLVTPGILEDVKLIKRSQRERQELELL